jgi:hypothetical protein
MSISPAATSSAINVWPVRTEGFCAASLRKNAMPFSSPIALATAANHGTSASSTAKRPAHFGSSSSSYVPGASDGFTRFVLYAST